MKADENKWDPYALAGAAWAAEYLETHPWETRYSSRWWLDAGAAGNAAFIKQFKKDRWLGTFDEGPARLTFQNGASAVLKLAVGPQS